MLGHVAGVDTASSAEWRGRGAQGAEGEEERQVGHDEGVDTANNARRVEKRREAGEEKKEEKGGRRKGRLVTSMLLDWADGWLGCGERL